MRKVYADVRMRDEMILSEEGVVSTQQGADRILFKGIWFRRVPFLDGQMRKDALGANQRLDGKCLGDGCSEVPDPSPLKGIRDNRWTYGSHPGFPPNDSPPCTT
jgi:hypothetical protein